MNKFHIKCGDRVTLLNQNLTAIRNFVEFNHGLILSADPLVDDAIFEVCIDRKVNVWNGSLEIGVTTLDPEFLELPATATKLRNTAWILSGNSILKDGVTIVSSYGPELDSLCEGDSIGVCRSTKGELLFSINSRCLGIAAKDLPSRLFAVIDLYGQCVQVSVVNGGNPRQIMEMPYEGTSSEAGACSLQRLHRDAHLQTPLTCPLVSQDNLRFHPRCGILVKLSNNNKSAERARPLDDYNNGVVMTHRPLYDNEFFEIRIDKLVDKWSGSIEVGVTSHNPATIRFPSTMTNMDSGTIMMSGCKVLMNGQGACMEYGNFNLDELREGDTVGMMKKHNSKLHYFINGVDQGVATDKVPQQVWGVVDLYGMTVKVTVVDPCEDMDSNINSLAARMLLCLPPPDGIACAVACTGSEGISGAVADGIAGTVPDGISVTVSSGITGPILNGTSGPSPETTVQMPAEEPVQPSTSSYEPPGCVGLLDDEELLFHTLRDSHVIIINDGRTAHRPNAFEIFNNGFVMTNRTLKTNELFQVRLDLVIPKWAGSIEVGVTQHSSNDIKFPFRMNNATSGTWGITGEDVIRDGTIIIPQYVRNLSRLVEGDTVGVMRKDMGILHFFVNGIDQGPAAFNIPEHVFGIIDLYGRVAQATIVDSYTPLAISSPESPMSFDSNATVLPEMCFHRVHGHNARLSRNRLTASRATVYSEFNDAVLFSSRALRECDMFEIRIDKMVDCWIGSLEIGVTAIRPDDLEASGGLGALAGTATDLSWDTYILSGSAMMKDGECVRNGYPLDLDTLTVGSRVGMMWHADRSLHYYLDGMDLGKAWYVPHLNIYAVVDLYGQCTQVTILQNEERAFNYNGCNTDHGVLLNPRSVPTPPPPYWSFSEYHGNNVALSKDYTVARRVTPDPMGALVFSSTHLIVNELYEIQILECKHSYAGSLRMGVTDVNVLNANINRHLPLCASWLPHFTAYIDGKYIKYSRSGPSSEKDLQSFVPSFEWLRPGDRIGLKKTSDSKVLVYYNSELLEVAFEKVPDKVYVLMELYGITTKIQTVFRGNNVILGNQNTIPNDKPESQTCAAPSESKTSMSEVPRSIEPGMMELGQAEEPVVPSPSVAANQPEEPDREFIASAPPLPMEDNVSGECVASSSAESQPPIREVVRQRRVALPYTFHFLTGNNIRLCSSDTVALRFRGYSDAVAVASQPLRRGQTFRFRVDKVSDEWEGTVAIGALAMLPTEMPPSTSLHFTMPCWVITNDVLYTRGIYTMSEVGRKLEEITENSVLTLHFRFNSELTLEIDGHMRGVIATIPRRFSDIFPTIDLYGRVVQVSILLHPHVVLCGTSLDLPMIEENFEEGDEGGVVAGLSDGPDSCSESEGNEQETESLPRETIFNHYTSPSDDEPVDDDDDDFFSNLEVMRSRNDLPYSEDRDDSSTNVDDVSNPIEQIQEIVEVYELYEPAPEASADAAPLSLSANDAKNSEIKAYQHDSPMQVESNHQNLLFDECVADNDLAAKSRGLKKSHSTQNLSPTQSTDESMPRCDDSSSSESLVNPLSLGSHILDSDSDSPDEVEDLCDTNIRHNDRYPEANEMQQSNEGYDASDAIDDHLDNVFIDAMFLETSNMPDLNEEQSLSVDESMTTRRDDYWADGLTVENLHYLNGIICWDQRVTGARVDQRDWVFYSETNGNCEVMHLALKFWNQIVAPYSDMREVVTGGNVHCFCTNCHPDSDPAYKGWVRIERAKAEDVACSQPLRMYWHVMRATVTSALALSDVTQREVRRPRSYCSDPSTSPTCADTWIDEEGKPHQAALALDVDIGGRDAESDRLLAYWIYLRSHASMVHEAVEDNEDMGEDTVEDILEDAGDDMHEAIQDDIVDGLARIAVAFMDDTLDLDEDPDSSAALQQ